MNFLKKFTVVALAAVALTACSDDDNGNAATVGGPKIRVINSFYRADTTFVLTPSTTIADTTHNDVVASSLDFMIDSGATGASSTDVTVTQFDDIPPNSISGLTPTSTSASSTSAYFVSNNNNGFVEFDVGVHSYVARAADSTTGRMAQLYRNNSDSLPYLPRQYLTAGTYYTWVVAGVANAIYSSSNAQKIPPTVVSFSALVDDPFPPPTLANGTYQARFRIINAATYAANTGAGATVSIYLTPGSQTPPVAGTGAGSIGALTTTAANTSFRSASAYVNVTAGQYWLTLSSGTSTILWQGLVTFSAGEVRTLVLQSTWAGGRNTSTTGAMSITGPNPDVTNHKLTNILDQQY